MFWLWFSLFFCFIVGVLLGLCVCDVLCFCGFKVSGVSGVLGFQGFLGFVYCVLMFVGGVVTCGLFCVFDSWGLLR